MSEILCLLTKLKAERDIPRRLRLLREEIDVKSGFIAKHQGIWPAEWLCGELGVSRGGLLIRTTTARRAFRLLRPGRTRTRSFRGSIPQGRWRRQAGQALTVPVRPAALRLAFRRSGAVVALPWCPRFLVSRQRPCSFGAGYRGQRMISDDVPGFGTRQCQGASPRKECGSIAICA
jgi:hypothetical protein